MKPVPLLSSPAVAEIQEKLCFVNGNSEIFSVPILDLRLRGDDKIIFFIRNNFTGS